MKKSEIDKILGRGTFASTTVTSQKDDDLNAVGRLGLTALDVVGNIGKGAVKTLEGIYDTGATVVGAIGGIFDSDFKDDVAEHVKYDATGELFDTIGFDYVEDNSYLEDNKVGGFVRNVAGGVGGMLPSVALSFIPGAGPVLGMVSMGVGAAGQATEEALHKGANFYSAAAYGAGMGVVEGATEMLGGFVLGGGKSLVGKALAGTKLGKFTSKGIGQVAETFISEGLEEVSTNYADVGMQFVTGVDRDWRKNLDQANKNALNTLAVGGTVGSMMQGGNVILRSVSNKERGGAKASRADESFSYISEVSKNYGNDVNKNARYDRAIDDALTDVSRELSSMDDTARKNYMDGMGAFKNAFNDDGSIKMDLRADVNDGAVSSNLRAISAVLEHAPVSADVEISEGASKAKSTVESLLQERASVVISDKIGKNNALYNPDEGIIYINNNAEFSGEEIAEFVATHEVAHITEGTRAYGEMAIALEEIVNDHNAPAALKAKIGDVQAREKAIRDTYQGQMENMSLMQREYLVGTELTADLAGIVFSDEYAINKLAERNLPLAKKIFNGLKSLVTRGRDVEGAVPYNQKNPSVDRESARYLNKLVNKFGKAIDKSQGGVRISQIGRRDEEKNTAENVDFVDEKRYNKYKQISKQEYGVLSSEIMRKNAKYMNENQELPLYGFAYTANYFYLYENFEIGSFGVVTQKRITDENRKYTEYVIKSLKENDNEWTITSTEHFNRMLKVLKTEYRNDNRNNVDDSRGQADIADGRILGENTQSDRKTDSRGSTENQRGKIDDTRYSKPKSEKFMPGRHILMTTAEELVEGYDADTISAEEALKKLNALGLKTDITLDNALDTLREFIPEIREYATSEREAYRESNKKEKSLSQQADSSAQGIPNKGHLYKGALSEEDANKRAKQSLDYWVSNGDYTQGTVRYVQNGKVKVKLAQTANEVQLAKFINNNIMSKSYTNKDVKNIIDKILSDINIWGGDWDSSYMAKLKSEDMTSVKKQLWAALNTAPEGERMGPALDIADYIVKHGVLTEVVSVTDDVYYAQTILDVLNTYKHKIDVSHIKGDIEAKYDTDRSPFTTWALKKNATERGYTADEVALELEEYGVVLNGDRGKLINEADIFIAIHELYNKSRQVIKDAAPSRNDIIGAFDADKVHEVKQKIANEILNSYDEYGKETAFSKVEKKYRKEIEGLKRRVKDVHEENRLKNAVLYEAQKIKDSKAGKYHNSTQVQDDSLKALKAILGRIKYRSDLNRSSTRAIINELAKWYTEDNPVLQGFMVDKKTSESRGLYSPHIKALIDLFLIEDAEGGQSRMPVPTIEIKKDSELARRIESADYSKYDVIREYLIEKFYNEEFVLSDGKKAIMDKRDAQHLAHNATEERTAQLAEIKKIIETANYSHSAHDVEHPKFSQFHYYDISVKYGDETFDLWLNVGTAKNDGKNHIYAITNKTEETPTNYGVARPVGNALQNASSNNSITENDEIVKAAEEKRAQKAQKPLDTTELEALNQILHHMNFVFETYGKIWRGGKWIEAKDVAKGQIAVLQEARENETVVGKLLNQGYFNFFMDPELVCARLDGADKNGYFTTLLEDLRQADIKQRHDEMLALQRYDEFEKKHKKYIKELMSEKNTVKVGNVIDHHAEGGPTADILEIPRYAALDLYMVSKTRGALETFAETGWVLRLDSNKKDFEKQNATITAAQIKGIEKQLTKEDIELIEIMEEQYNVNLRRLKYETDMIRLGMSNVFDGYYYPINRISANNLDSNDFFFDLERVSNSSFNNSRVKGAKQAIIVSNVLTKFKKHVNGVTRYANLSIPIENMTKLLNINIGTNDNMPQSITMLLRETKDGLEAEKYVKTLIKDVQQVNIQTDASTKAVSYLRGAYAKSTLGFNPKVLFTQASSYIAGFGELRGSSLAYGVANIGKLKGLDGELDKYCPWAAVRHYEKGTTRAMTVTDKVNKFGDSFTKGIEFMDRQIVKLEFVACQKEAQARFGLKIGTEENKIKAGELLQELGLKTQQNQLTTEKSAAMRSQSEFAKTLTMFKADSMKQVSRFLQTINAMSTLKKKMDAAKRSGDNTKYSALEVEYKKAQKSFCKYSAVIIASSVYMVLLARLFNKLYRKEEEDENKVLGYFEDIFGNICGMVPIISELYAFFIDGFEVNSFMYSTINNSMDAVKGTTELVSGLANGEDISSEKAMTEIRKLAYSIGALAGIPTKNVYKNTKALVDIISPTTGDRVDSWFKEPSEKSLEEKIEAGIEKGDDKAVSVSLDLLYGKYDLELEDTVLRREYDRLMRLEMTKSDEDTKNGVKYTPLEAKIPDSIKVNEEEVELLQKDVNVFKSAFKELEKSQANVVKTLPYKKLSDEERAYALRKISQYYLEDTKYTYTGEKSNFAYYAKVVGIEDMALIVAYAKNLKGDAEQSRREKIEAYIKSLRLNKVQTSLALRSLGYSDKENDEMVMSYVKKCYLLTKTEREELYEKVKPKEEEESSSTSTKASSTKKVQFVFN